LAYRARGGIDEAAFDAAVGDDELALLLEGPTNGQCDVLQRMAGEAAAEVLAPTTGGRDIEAAVRRLQGRDVDATLRQQGHPGAVGPQARPARATECEHDDVGTQDHLTGRRCEAQRAIVVPAEPPMPHVNPHPLPAQAM